MPSGILREESPDSAHIPTKRHPRIWSAQPDHHHVHVFVIGLQTPLQQRAFLVAVLPPPQFVPVGRLHWPAWGVRGPQHTSLADVQTDVHVPFWHVSPEHASPSLQAVPFGLAASPHTLFTHAACLH
jgi:hypothetical protein